MATVSPAPITTSRPSLMALYNAIAKQMETIVAAAGETLPSFGIGAKDVFNHNGQPRISWVPLGGPVTKPKSRGGDFADNPRPLWHRHFSSAAYLWAKNIDAANTLANHLVAAIDAVVHGSYAITKESWEVTGDQDAGNVVYIIFEIGVPFVDVMSQTVQPTIGSLTQEIGDA